MKNLCLCKILTAMMVVEVLWLSSGLSLAANDVTLTPELAAKRENYRKQNEQRITSEKRKAAAETLKAERLKVYRAKQTVKQSTTSD